jgi:hypothetical protein
VLFETSFSPAMMAISFRKRRPRGVHLTIRPLETEAGSNSQGYIKRRDTGFRQKLKVAAASRKKKKSDDGTKKDK